MVTYKEIEDVIDFSEIKPMYEWIDAFVEGIGRRAADEEQRAHATSHTLVRLERSGAMLEEWKLLVKSALEIMSPEQRRAFFVTLKSSDLPLSLPQHHSRNA
jgi:hypothetical protein